MQDAGSCRGREIRVVDCHAHAKWYGYDAHKLVQNMDEHGIDVMWLLTWEAPEHEIEAGYTPVFWPGRHCMPLADVLEAVQLYPERFVAFYAPDPRSPDSLAKLRGAVKYWGVRGCGEMKCRITMDDPHAMEMWWFCGENGLPVIFHMDVPLPRGRYDKPPGYWFCCDWENLARALEACPKTTFLGHAPGFWREISGDANEATDVYPSGPVTPGGRLWDYMDRYPNLGCDLSAGSAHIALSRDRSIGREFLLTYQDRCLFGRDYFDATMHDFIKGLDLPQEAYAKIMGGNALRLVPL